MSLIYRRFSYAFVVAVAVCFIFLAIFNREQPLDANSIPTSIQTQLRWSHSGKSNWKEIRYEVDRTFTSSYGKTEDVRVKYRLENLGNGLVHRSDNWYPRHIGNALIYEERYILYANLIGFSSRYRETAPVFHAIFENTGWLENKLIDASLQIPDLKNFDSKWQVKTTLIQLQDVFPMVAGSKVDRVTKDTTCVSTSLHAGLNKKRVVVSCDVKRTDGTSRKATYAFLVEVGIFILNSYDDTNGEESVSGSSAIRKLQVDGVELQY
ncbi:MAG: hypothetical protein WBK51_13280 [Polaromonas sp.]